MKEVREQAIQICQGQAFQRGYSKCKGPVAEACTACPGKPLWLHQSGVQWRGADDEAKDLGMVCLAALADHYKGSAGKDPIRSSYGRDSRR